MPSARALVLEAPRHPVSRELPLPVIGDDDGLLRVEACGLCGTDHAEFTGELFPGYSFVPGRVAGLDEVSALHSVMAGEGEMPPVHAVVVPDTDAIRW